jgi:hypothetical protein
MISDPFFIKIKKPAFRACKILDLSSPSQTRKALRFLGTLYRPFPISKKGTGYFFTTIFPYLALGEMARRIFIFSLYYKNSSPFVKERNVREKREKGDSDLFSQKGEATSSPLFTLR